MSKFSSAYCLPKLYYRIDPNRALFQLLICTVGVFGFNSIAIAQITPDGTTSTTVNGTGNELMIEQGDRAGGNLFHSFEGFSLPTGGLASFNNGADVSNIFNRVTGGDISNINGTIRANGSANLFLINPAGVVFGEGASLDIGGSFYGSSATSILFEDGAFSAVDNLEQPILTINAPIGLGFRSEAGAIINRSTANNVGLQIASGENIGLIGGDVTLEGGLITAPGGTVELGGLAEAGTISISDNRFSFPADIARSDVELNSDANVSVAAGGGGFINVNANNLLLSDASELIAGIAENMGSADAQAGDINVDAVESVTLVGAEDLFPELQTGIRNDIGDRAIVRTRRDESDRANQSLTSSAVGNGGAININTPLLDFQDDGKVSTVNYGRNGNAGNINITTNSISLALGTIETFSREGAVGNSGDVNITNANEISIGDNSEIQTQISTEATGDVGDINIETGSLTLGKLSFIQADTNNGVEANAGNININARESIELNGSLSLIISQIQEGGEGNAGEIRITTPNLSLRNFSLISTNVKQDTIGSAGTVFLDVGNLNITEGAVIDSLTENNSPGGNIQITADQINLSDGGKIVTSGNSGGDAGNITLEVTDSILIDNENPAVDEDSDNGTPFEEQILQNTTSDTGIFASTIEGSTGNSGNINIQSGSIELTNSGSIEAVAQAGTEGNIALTTTEDITLSNGGFISAQAFNNANGGNVNIDSRFIIALPNSNSDILANASQGEGGVINIETEALLGIKERALSIETNDINASSNFNLDGTVSINILRFDPVQGVTELPRNVVETGETVAQACSSDRNAQAANSLTVTGKGGVPTSPVSPLGSNNLIVDGAIADSDPAVAAPIETSQGKIQPARGVKVTDSGVILTAYRTDNAGKRVPAIKRNCM